MIVDWDEIDDNYTCVYNWAILCDKSTCMFLLFILSFQV